MITLMVYNRTTRVFIYVKNNLFYTKKVVKLAKMDTGSERFVQYL